MKPKKQVTPPKFMEPLYAVEHDGRSYAGNCGGCQLDVNHWGWEFKSDCYYNSPPLRMKDGKWLNVSPGLYVTEDVATVVLLLKAPDLTKKFEYKPAVTPRAITALNELGYNVTLFRYKASSVIQTLEVEVYHAPGQCISERITKNETTVNGKAT